MALGDQRYFLMKNEIIRGQSPEEHELSIKLLELAGLEMELTQRELDLVTILKQDIFES